MQLIGATSLELELYQIQIEWEKHHASEFQTRVTVALSSAYNELQRLRERVRELEAMLRRLTPEDRARELLNMDSAGHVCLYSVATLASVIRAERATGWIEGREAASMKAGTPSVRDGQAAREFRVEIAHEINALKPPEIP